MKTLSPDLKWILLGIVGNILIAFLIFALTREIFPFFMVFLFIPSWFVIFKQAQKK